MGKRNTDLNLIKYFKTIEKGIFSHKNCKRTISNEKGAVTVEASIVLPLFICVIISIAFLIRVVHTHEVIQHAISNTAAEMAFSSYLYYISGLQESHDSIQDEISDKAGIFRKHLSTVLEAYGELKNFSGAAQNMFDHTELPNSVTGLQGWPNGIDGFERGFDQIQDSFKNLENVLKEIVDDPLAEFKSIAFFAAQGLFEDIKTELCIPIVKLYMKKYLSDREEIEADRRLKRLNIVDGLNGLDFSRSSFFEDQNNDIDIIVEYKMEIPVPIKIFPELAITQRAVAKAWLGGNSIGADSEEDNEGNNEENYDDLWFLNNFQRGRKIRKIFGANLPDNFPVIASFKSGTAIMIKSMDITASSYQSGEGVEKKLREYIDELAAFSGQERPWGKAGIVIRREEIKAKQLLLVIPSNPVTEEIQKAINRCVEYARVKGIELKVERYGYKDIDKGDGPGEGDNSG